MARSAGSRDGTRILKKYSNRRIYDTATSRYVTLVDVERLAADGAPFQVVDATTGEDLTRLTLLQTLLELGKDKISLLPLSFLRFLVASRASALTDFSERYLGVALQLFGRSQQDFSRQFQGLFDMMPLAGSAPSVSASLEGSSFGMFPGFPLPGQTPASPASPAPAAAAAAAAAPDPAIAALREEVARLREAVTARAGKPVAASHKTRPVKAPRTAARRRAERRE